MLNEDALKAYLRKEFSSSGAITIRKLGSGVQGAGFLIEMAMPEGTRSYVVKTLIPEGLGHDYPSDRAAVFLLDLDEYKNLPQHVKAIDVLAELEDGTVKSIGGGKEYYLLMERGEGRDYFTDLKDFSRKDRLDRDDIEKIRQMTSYLADIHAKKKESRSLYWRKIRDTIGHGECLMGVFDLYPDGTLSYEEMAEIEKRCIDWRVRLKPKIHRLAQIHGDFHPGNIWFTTNAMEARRHGDAESTTTTGEPSPSVAASLRPPGTDFILLDRSRGPWGDPADDVTALTINYIFFSLIAHGQVTGPYYEALELFFNEYVRLSGDTEIYEVLAPFFAFRGAVVANPVFYPDVSGDARKKIFNFVNNVLLSDRFEVRKVNDYL
ncbi:MAG: phosphotransferase family protein [Nitrospirota bacterium]